jgi:hypothetical protein
MALIDYKGFRVVAYADMGIDENADTVFDLQGDRRDLKADDVAAGKMAEVARKLNLKTHHVQIGKDRRVQVHLSSTVEVHLEKSARKRYYAVNLFEMFAMDFFPVSETPNATPTSSPSRRTTTTVVSAPSPTPGSTMRADTPSSFLQQSLPDATKRLRPEFLAAYTTPLTSDAFTTASGCGKKEREVNDSEVSRASRFLRENWVPAFVKKLDDLEIRVVDSREFGMIMHRSGVNIRYLG